jgi:hypothetical protein
MELHSSNSILLNIGMKLHTPKSILLTFENGAAYFTQHSARSWKCSCIIVNSILLIPQKGAAYSTGCSAKSCKELHTRRSIRLTFDNGAVYSTQYSAQSWKWSCILRRTSANSRKLFCIPLRLSSHLLERSCILSAVCPLSTLGNGTRAYPSHDGCILSKTVSLSLLVF